MRASACSPKRSFADSRIGKFGESARPLVTYSPICRFADLPICRFADLPICRSNRPRSRRSQPISGPLSSGRIFALRRGTREPFGTRIFNGFPEASEPPLQGAPCTRPSGETAMGIPIAYPAIFFRPAERRARDANAVARPRTKQQRSEVSHRRSASQEQRGVRPV